MDSAPAAHSLAAHLETRHPDLIVQVTTVPPQNPEQFLREMRPNLCLWFSPYKSGPLTRALQLTNCKTILVNEDGTLDLPGRAALRFLLAVCCDSHVSALAAQKRGMPVARCHATGPVSVLPDPPACNEAELEDLTDQIMARPVWLALMPEAAEMPAVLAAHKAALQATHRSLLILYPGADIDGDSLQRDLKAEGWHVGNQMDFDNPSMITEIYIADPETPIGLWLRLASVTFLGGSFGSGAGCDPGGAAALGSALVSGPKAGKYAETLKSLRNARALRWVETEEDLPKALADVLLPQHAAALAGAAWQMITQGAEATQAVTAIVEDALDLKVAS
ncbi:hypothetical protein IV417_11090 [Alphaproteobacteria bacterium KMM 3653]|uniref:3-deoxy-D-manno-octulosonic acid transferase n=1 Tax=Harenicola maris TaxID=2841044 RepID=A0AAP2CP03_9RHOB|nr:hypothetical protein [Harenicola maris]